MTRVSKISFLILVALIVVFGFAAAALADGRVIQNDPDNPIKFSIDAAIADGSTSTSDLYIGTVGSYLGAKADGSTPVFQEGFGKSPYDILIMNDKVGIVLAIGTPDPWGYPGGSVLDAGRVVSLPAGATDLKGATFGPDTVLTVQFLFNTWDAWAPANTGIVYCDLVKYDFAAKAIDDVKGVPAVQVKRKFAVPYNDGGVSVARDLDVISYYSIPADEEYAYMFDTVVNNGVAFSKECANEVSLSNKGGDGIDTKTVAALDAANTYNWVADKAGEPTRAFSTTIISPGDNPGSDGRLHPLESFTGARGYRELAFADPGYIVGEKRAYESYLMIDDECSWQGVIDFYAAYNHLDTFRVAGDVTDQAGAPVAYPVVVIYRGTTLYGWVMGDKAGHYTVDLPDESAAEPYHLQVEKSGTTAGPASSDFTAATIPAGAMDLKAGDYLVPVKFHFRDQSGDAVWGRVSVGTTPTIAFTGQTFFFSDNEPDGSVSKGEVTALVKPGDYSARCYGEGFGFYSYTTSTSTYSETLTGNTAVDTDRTVTIQKTLSAPVDWFGIDNHHHGVRSDAFSPPEVVAKAQTTAGLEVLTLDDHEYVVDNIRVYDWARKMGVTGYMPSEEVTPSWAHFDVMPLTKAAYARFLDRDQKNGIVNTNASLQGIIDDGHNAGVAIGANHPNSSYGLFLADDNKTVPGGMTDDFDGIEAQFRTNTLGEAMSYWTAYTTGGSHRGVAVKRPHYIYASTDIHDSGGGTGSGGRRSYVFVKDGAEQSASDFEGFSLDFARSQAAGHSFSSSGVFITPTSGKMYGNTYRADATGTFSASFKVSALNPITNIYVFGSTGTGTGTAPFAMNNLVSQTTYAGDELSTSKDFTLTVNDVSGKQWYAIAAVSSDNKQAFTNPIWVNGPDVTTPVTITDLHAIITPPDVPVAGRVLEQPPTAVLTTTPWCGFRLADWELVKGEFGSVAENNVEYVFTLTFHAPKGYVFDPALSTAGNFGRKVSEDGARLIYRAIYTTEPPTTTVAGCPAGWVRGPVTLDFTAEPAPEGADVAYTEYRVDGGAWVKGTSVTIKRQGVTVVSYRSTDMRDNVEPAKTCTVRIDRVAPAVRGYGRPMARQGRLLRCQYKVTDALSAKVTAKLVVKRVHSKKSRSYDLGVKRTGRRLVTGVNCDLGAGTWAWRVKARDQAGNVGYGAWRYLVVYRR